QKEIVMLRKGFLIALLLTVATIPFVTTRGRTAPANNQQPAPPKFHKTAKPVKDQYIVVLRSDTNKAEVKSSPRACAHLFRNHSSHLQTRNQGILDSVDRGSGDRAQPGSTSRVRRRGWRSRTRHYPDEPAVMGPRPYRPARPSAQRRLQFQQCPDRLGCECLRNR